MSVGVRGQEGRPLRRRSCDSGTHGGGEAVALPTATGEDLRLRCRRRLRPCSPHSSTRTRAAPATPACGCPMPCPPLRCPEGSLTLMSRGDGEASC